jgi:hypothetical protein
MFQLHIETAVSSTQAPEQTTYKGNLVNMAHAWIKNYKLLPKKVKCNIKN